MKDPVRRANDFTWRDVSLLEYKSEGTHFRDITRQVLFGPEAGLSCELRYFEVQPGGYSTLEKHAHTHAVLILRGHGRVLVGTGVHAVGPNDVVHVEPHTLHQFRPEGDAPLGFLCMVDCDRDRPVLPTEAELEALRAHPEAARFIRT